MSKIEVIVGGQFGSEGKGAVAGHLAGRVAQDAPLLAMRVAGPNAGHTVIGDYGVDTSDSISPNLCERVSDASPIPAWQTDEAIQTDRFAWRLRQVPVAAVTNPKAVLAIAAGSEVDLDVLANEVAALDAAGYNVSARLVVDHSVTVIHGYHKIAESNGHDPLTQRVGSTGKGIGAARMDRLARVDDVCLVNNEAAWEYVHTFANTDDVANLAAGLLRASQQGVVQVEGAQGYGLGLHAGYYPYCTSSDCRAIDFLAMAGVSPWQQVPTRPGQVFEGACALDVWVCVRPYPIRVGGNSGPLRGETTWDELGLPTEHTTVTGKVRRVGGWDGDLVRRAVRANGGPGGSVKVALTMFDTVAPAVAGRTSFVGLERLSESARTTQERLTFYEAEIGQPITLLGTGPDTVIDLDATSAMRRNGQIESPSRTVSELGRLVGDPTQVAANDLA